MALVITKTSQANTNTTTITLSLALPTQLLSLSEAVCALGSAAVAAIELQVRSLLGLCTNATSQPELQLLKDLEVTGDRLEAHALRLRWA